ncbi:hypothetical protein F383_23286 [Gossypium arboreum]|uniref:Uncharacterized protein n=1 Tax=Gossypium arboreum TaxID=29729 RepID=A0A0B0NX47_GOSAR|nr:hypothetical protein F383_23286 [Gossypium arboreum]
MTDECPFSKRKNRQESERILNGKEERKCECLKCLSNDQPKGVFIAEEGC